MVLEDAQTTAVPDEDLAQLPRLIDEQVQVAAHRILPKTLLDESEQAVVAVAQVDRRRIPEHAPCRVRG
jgi:hypothetical protein